MSTTFGAFAAAGTLPGWQRWALHGTDWLPSNVRAVISRTSNDLSGFQVDCPTHGAIWVDPTSLSALVLEVASVHARHQPLRRVSVARKSRRRVGCSS